MGNSPSRSELHGEHMSSIANNTGQETFQSHSYPATKFSTNPLPGIHGEGGGVKISSQGNSEHRHSSGLTPDPMYSMDSLNVTGNNAASITSSELPPSSISPENHRDPWVASSFSDESLHAQCRHMSRHHKNNHTSDDDTLSLSTFESDSLNPDATLSCMNPKKSNSPCSKRETTPKPEVAEEATEEIPVRKIVQYNPPVSAPSNIVVDHGGITINGRKVSACEETPLPIILGSNKESKIGITAAEVNVISPIPPATNGSYGTIKRGRMKSPPPPPPPVKSVGNGASDKSNPSLVPRSGNEANEKKDFQASLNALLHRNVYSSNRRSSVEISDTKTLCGGEVNVIQTPLSQPTELNGSGCNGSAGGISPILLIPPTTETCADLTETKKSDVDLIENVISKEELAPSTTTTTPAASQVASFPISELTNRKSSSGSSKSTNDEVSTNNIMDILSCPQLEGKPPRVNNADLDIVIRPCEQSKHTENYTVASTQSMASKDDDTGLNRSHSSPTTKELLTANESTSENIIKSTETKLDDGNNDDSAVENKSEEMQAEENCTNQNNKTELDCEDHERDDADARADAIMNTISTTATDEIKPVSCAANGEKLNMKRECETSRDDEEDDDNEGTNKSNMVIDGSHGHPFLNNTKETKPGPLGKPERDEEQTPEDTNVNTSSSLTDSKASVVTALPSSPVPGNIALTEVEHDAHSKFGRGEEGKEEDKIEEKLSPNKSQASIIPLPPPPPPPPLLFDSTGNERYESHSSKSSSRRGSSASSLEFNMPPPSSNGLLNCNRISLCSLPDNNEMEFEVFETVEDIMNNGAIQDQPLSNNSASDLMGSCTPELIPNPASETEEVKDVAKEENKGNPEIEEKKEMKQQDEQELVKVESPTTTNAKDVNENSPPSRKNSRDDNGLVNALRSSLEGLIPMLEPNGRNIPAKAMNSGHQRRLSMSKIDFDSAKTLGDSLASSVPNTASPFEKFSANRKGSFPELFINTTSSETRRNQLLETAPPVKKLTSTNPFLDSEAKTESNVVSSTTNPFVFINKLANSTEAVENSSTRGKIASDFLQTLGEIYACKSKLISKPGNESKSPPRSNAASLPSSPKEKDLPSVVVVASKTPIISTATKTGEPSLEPMDLLLECQDRSISEYNISPRSARELISDSLLNCSSLTSSLSHKSIGTIQEEVDDKVVAFSAGVEVETPVLIDLDANSNTGITTVDAFHNDNMIIPRSNPSKSLTANHNSGTFKKKPTFIRGKAPPGNSLPCIEIFDQPKTSHVSINKTDNLVPVDDAVKTESEPMNFPPPPPMPPLQYCHTTSESSASASSSIGDSSEIFEKNKTFRRVRHSPEKSLSKSASGSGTLSSECSLVELNGPNTKSTSDAIINELKKAQAKKLKAMEQKRPEALLIDFPTSRKEPEENIIKSTVTVRGEEKPKEKLENSPLGVDCTTLLSTTEPSVNGCGGKQLEDASVKTIVNGKHTNSIVVNNGAATIPVKDNLKCINRIGGDHVKKFSSARARGNIMSPSLSGNYTEMNGIDSETMGASSIHDDEISGQLQQKENHINELHGNVDDVQISNKVDGASFRRVLNEYEKTLSMFIQQIDQLKQRMEEADAEKQTLIKERDQALEDLRNVESAFSDVHRKYERAKALLENMKTNEDTLIRRDQEMMQRIQNRDKKIEMIKEKAQESIEKMHLDYETRIKEMEFENAKLRAQYRKMEMKLSTLENDVEQKAKENAQLSALCDELINGQVGQV